MAHHKVRDVMTPEPVALDLDMSVAEAARLMRDFGIGDVLATDDDQLRGVVTDRDIVVRMLAEDRSAEETTLGDICTTDALCIGPDDDIADAVLMMRNAAIRRLPVVDDQNHPIGIVTIGDLAQSEDRSSALADISSAPPNN